jgi:hypothetical protein
MTHAAAARSRTAASASTSGSPGRRSSAGWRELDEDAGRDAFLEATLLVVWSFVRREGRAVTMPVRRDKRTGGWIFQATVRFADRTRKRIFGTPGVPGPYQDLSRSRVGALEAERRAISEAMHGKPLEAATVTKEAPKTIEEHAEKFVDTYKPGSKPSEKREKRRVLKRHLLPFFGAKTIEGLKQTDVDTYAKSELDRGMAIKTVNNQLAVLSTHQVCDRREVEAAVQARRYGGRAPRGRERRRREAAREVRGQAIRSGDPTCFGSWSSRCGDPWPAMDRRQVRADHGVVRSTR